MTLPRLDTRSESDEVLKALRRRAISALEAGHKGRLVAAILGVSPETVSRWWTAYKAEGPEALPQGRTGRPQGSGRLLNDAQATRIQDLLDDHDNTPEKLGIASALWTRRAVRDLINKETGQSMPIRTVGEYLRRWGYTPHKPFRKSRQQDPEKVKEWLEKTYPEIAKRAEKEGGEIHWGDEMGVRSTCSTGRGYSRPGKTPVLPVGGTRFSVNQISTITNAGKVHFLTYKGTMNSALFLVFLGQLIKDCKNKVFLIGDNLSVHVSKEVEAWLQDKKARIELFTLPKYSPELNPDEYLNCDVKGNINDDGLPDSREQLHSKLEAFMAKLAGLPQRIIGYFKHRFIAYAAAPKLEPST
jgi:transposase